MFLCLYYQYSYRFIINIIYYSVMSRYSSRISNALTSDQGLRMPHTSAWM